MYIFRHQSMYSIFCISAFFGYAITIIPRYFTFYISSFLFAVFGIKMLREGWKMSPNVSVLHLLALWTAFSKVWYRILQMALSYGLDKAFLHFLPFLIISRSGARRPKALYDGTSIYHQRGQKMKK